MHTSKPSTFWERVQHNTQENTVPRPKHPDAQDKTVSPYANQYTQEDNKGCPEPGQQAKNQTADTQLEGPQNPKDKISPPQPYRRQQKTYRRRATHLGLQPPLKHLLGGELKHEVELLLVLAEETEPRHAAEQRGALEQTLGVLRVEGKQLAGSLPGDGRYANRRAKERRFL